jgi:hypothetical protein
MPYRPGDPYYGEFVTSVFSTGAAADADSLPVATANKNGTDDGAFTLTVTKIDTGRYKVTGTIPAGYAVGDVVNVSVAATVATVAGKGVVDSFVLDTKAFIPGNVNDGAPGAGGFVGNAGLASTDAFYAGCVLAWTSGTLKGLARKISTYTGATRTLAFTGPTGATDAPFPSAPANGDTFILLGRIG